MADIVQNGRILGNVGMHQLPGEEVKFIIYLSEVYVQTPDDSQPIARWHLVARRDAFTDTSGTLIPASWIVFDREYAYEQIADNNLLLYPYTINLIHQHVSHQYDILGQYRNIIPAFTPNDVAIKDNPKSANIPDDETSPEPFTILGDGVSREYILNLINAVTPIPEVQSSEEVRMIGLGVPEVLEYSADLSSGLVRHLGFALVLTEIASRAIYDRPFIFGRNSMLFGDGTTKRRGKRK